MEVGSPEWIEASLARLDELERERAQHEAALETVDDAAALKQHSEALDRLDTEIKSLYAQLEAVAEDDEDEGESEGEGEAPQVTQGDDELSSPHVTSAPEPEPEPELEPAPAPAPEPAPMAEPLAAAADNPFASPPAAAEFGGGGGFDAPAVGSYDDLEPKGGGGKWAFLVVVLLVGGGGGGYFAWQNMQKGQEETKAAPDEPVKVIKAADIPDDTEAPPTAPSGKALISPNAAGDGDDDKKKKKKEEEEGKKPLKIGGGEAPLGGI